MMSEFSPSMLNALNGLLQNKGLGVSSIMKQTLSEYRETDLVKSIRLVNTASNKITDTSVFSKWNSFISTIPLAITDILAQPLPQYNGPESVPNPIQTIPTSIVANTLSSSVEEWANITLYNGDLSKFVQLFSTYRGQLTQINSVVEPVGKSLSSAATRAFRDSSYTVTGGASDLSSDLSQFGKDLENSGFIFDFRYLDQISVPSYLLANIVEKSGGIPAGLLSALFAQNVEQVTVDLAVNREIIPNREQAKIYRAFQNVSGNELMQILRIMRVTTENLQNLSDVMDVKQILPNSWNTLKFRKGKQVFMLFENGTINQEVKHAIRYDSFVPQVPEITVIPLLVLARNLKQIKGIKEFETVKFAKIIQQIETVADLTDIASLDQPTVDLTNIISVFGSGSGENSKYTITDVIGTVAGIPHTSNYIRINEILNELNSSTQLLQFHFTRIKNTLYDEVYTSMVDPGDPGDAEVEPPIPPRPPTYQITIPNIGSFPSSIPINPEQLPNPPVNPYNAALDTLLDLAIPVLNDFVNTNQEKIQELNELYASSLSSLLQEISFRNNVESENNFEFALLTSQTTALVSFAKSLHEYAKSNDLVEFFVLMSDNTVTGQAIVSSLREGKNISLYAEIGSLMNPTI